MGNCESAWIHSRMLVTIRPTNRKGKTMKKFTIETTERAEQLAEQFRETLAAWEGMGEETEQKRAEWCDICAEYDKQCSELNTAKGAREINKILFKCKQIERKRDRARETWDNCGYLREALMQSLLTTGEAYALELFRANFSQIEGTPEHYKKVTDFLRAIAQSLDERATLTRYGKAQGFGASFGIAFNCSHYSFDRDTYNYSVPRFANLSYDNLKLTFETVGGYDAEWIDKSAEAGATVAECRRVCSEWRAAREQLEKLAKFYKDSAQKTISQFWGAAPESLKKELAEVATVRFYY